MLVSKAKQVETMQVDYDFLRFRNFSSENSEADKVLSLEFRHYPVRARRIAKLELK